MAASGRDTDMTSDSRPAMLWAAWLAGPVAWTLHLNLSYVLVPWVCASGAPAVLHLVTLGSLLIAGVGAAMAWRVWRRSTEARPEPPAATRTRFMAIAGLLSAAYFVTVIVAQAVPVFLVPPCL